MRNFGPAMRLFAMLLAAAAPQFANPAQADVDWPDSLKSSGVGFPKPGDPCRRVGETAATAPFLDHTSMLVACPGSRGSIVVAKFLAANGGRVVGNVDGFSLVAVPPANPKRAAPEGSGVFNVKLLCSKSTAMLPCSYDVIRKDGGVTIVSITWPDGRKRAIFFSNGRITGADLNKADGSAKYRVTASKEVDRYLVVIGDERYTIPEVLVERQ